ncbi:MAG: hypothetical protein WCD79_14005, partial [Chthoniobacteraceae bacterium]
NQDIVIGNDFNLGQNFMWTSGSIRYLRDMMPDGVADQFAPFIAPIGLTNQDAVTGNTLMPFTGTQIVGGTTQSGTFIMSGSGTTHRWSIVQSGSVAPKQMNSSGIIATITSSGSAALLVPFQVTSVSFSGTSYWQLESDDGTTQYAAPQWTGTMRTSGMGDQNYAVAYTRNTTPKIGATFKMLLASAAKSIKIQATGPDQFGIPVTTGSISPDGVTVTLPITSSTCALPNTIKYYNKTDSTSFTLNWKISTDGGNTWQSITKTQHTMYVTLADPLTPANERQLTLFDTACRKATGLTDTTAIVNAVYSVFTHKDSKGIPDVERINPATSQPDGVELTYWSTTNPAPPPQCWRTAGLLSIGDGRCGAWASFLYDALRVDGIALTVETVNPPENNVPGAPGSTGPPSFYAVAQTKLHNDINTFLPSGTYKVIPIFYVKHWDLSTSITAPFSPVRQTGVAGQGNPNPRAEFDNHAVVQDSSGNIYDPSYGSPVFPSRVSWEDSSLDGYGAYIINLTTGAQYKWIWEADPKGTQETIFQP